MGEQKPRVAIVGDPSVTAAVVRSLANSESQINIEEQKPRKKLASVGGLVAMATLGTLLESLGRGSYADMPMPRIKHYYSTGKRLPNTQGRNEKCNCGSGLKYKKCCGM